MKLNKMLIVMLLIFSIFIMSSKSGSGCGSDEDKNNSQVTEKKRTEKNHSSLSKNQPAPFIKYSLERENLVKRLKRWNKPNKISYIYLVSFGKIMGFYAIKGKVSSVNSLLTSPKQMVYDSNGSYKVGSKVMPSPDFDGSYGSNGDGVFFFLTDGTYMEWNGKYILVDRPLRVSQPPVTVINYKR